MSRDLAPRRVLFFGDSLVAGVGDPAGGGWVARVVAAAFARGTPLTAYNLGVRRENSVQVATRWRAELAPRVPPYADARIVVSFGANDTTVEDGEVREPTERSVDAVRTIIEQASALQIPQLVVGPAPVEDAEQNSRIRALSRSFRELCEARGTPFIAVVEALLESSVWMSEVAGADGAHPRADGYQTLAELLIARGLLAWLSEPAVTNVA